MPSDDASVPVGRDLVLPFVFVHADEPPPGDPITSRFAPALPALLIPDDRPSPLPG